MVITVEPGCYFNPALLLPAFEVSQGVWGRWVQGANRSGQRAGADELPLYATSCKEGRMRPSRSNPALDGANKG
jgi:hypothetical protein